MSLTDILQLLVGGLTMGAIYALVATGYHIIYAATRAINFAQGEQVVLGGVIALTLTETLHWPLPVALALTLLLGALIGYAYERAAIRPLLGASELAIIISSIGVAIVLANGEAILWGKEPHPFPAFSGDEPLVAGGVRIAPQTVWVVGLTAAMLVVLWLFFNHTMLGKAIRAAASNRTAARLVGIRPTTVVAASFALSGALGGLAGVIMSPITFAGGALGTPIALKGFAGAVLGGITAAPAAVFGGLLLGILEMAVASFISSGYRDAIAFTVLVLVLVGRPQGLFVWARALVRT